MRDYDVDADLRDYVAALGDGRPQTTPLGDHREQAIPCSKCGRQTWNLTLCDACRQEDPTDQVHRLDIAFDAIGDILDAIRRGEVVDMETTRLLEDAHSLIAEAANRLNRERPARR